MIGPLMRDERGAAMIAAVLAVMAIAILSATAYTVSTHDVESSGIDRQRVQAVGAAEAGINHAYLVVEGTLSGLLPCGAVLSNEVMKASPNAKYTVDVKYFSNADGTGDIACVGSPPRPATLPASMLVTSVGTDRSTMRKMESLVRLTLGPGGAFGNDAVYAQTTADFKGQANVYGNPDNGDVFSNQPLNLNGGGTINGAARSTQTVTLGGGTQVKRDIYANEDVRIHGGSIAWADVNSARGSIAVEGTGSQIKGDANACSGISASADGVLGAENATACPPLLSGRSWSDYSYDPAHWPGYGTPQNTDGTDVDLSGPNACLNAEAWIKNNLQSPNTTAGSFVLRITRVCELSIKKLTSLRGPEGSGLAIITDGSIKFTSAGAFASGDGIMHKLALMTGVGREPGSGACSANDGDISLNGGNYTNVEVLLYTPCSVKNTAGTFVATGQIYAGKVDFNAGAALTFKGFTIPGLSTSYYNQDIAYIREIKSS